jgi:hypothetical protein
MTVQSPAAPSQRWTAIELLKLPPDQRDAILQDAAALAENEYRNSAELTDFEAFGTEDLHGGSANTQTR